jgi:hypothetical protein
MFKSHNHNAVYQFELEYCNLEDQNCNPGFDKSLNTDTLFYSLYVLERFGAVIKCTGWAGQLSRYSDWLRAGRSGDLIPVWGEIFRTCPDRPWVPPSLLYNGYRVFPGGRKRPQRDSDSSHLSSAEV